MNKEGDKKDKVYLEEMTYSEAKNLFEKTVGVIKRRGLIKFFKFFLEYLYYNFKPASKFKLDGKGYKVYRNFKCPLTPWRGEREAELPIFKNILDHYDPKDVLEVGNVLRNYYPVNFTVLDKYERGKGIINDDAADYKSTKKYNLILSISTIEHIGLDEENAEPKKVLFAIKNLMKLLRKNGKFIFSYTLNYNHYLDDLVRKDGLKFSYKKILKKVKNKWVQIPFEEYIKSGEIAKPNSVLFIGEIVKDSS